MFLQFRSIHCLIDNDSQKKNYLSFFFPFLLSSQKKITLVFCLYIYFLVHSLYILQQRVIYIYIFWYINLTFLSLFYLLLLWNNFCIVFCFLFGHDNFFNIFMYDPFFFCSFAVFWILSFYETILLFYDTIKTFESISKKKNSYIYIYIYIVIIFRR